MAGRHEWVQLRDGRICVREVDLWDAAQLVRGGCWQLEDPIATLPQLSAMLRLTCYQGEDDAALRTFPPDVAPAEVLSLGEVQALIEAIARVHPAGGGEDGEERPL